jgi:hypothetical protein
VQGLSLSAAYRPADGPAAGGDFYDLFELGDRRVGVVLGDVSGHGRDSVAQAALARYTLRTVLADGHGPGEALARADRLLERDLPPHFVTVVAAVYDDRTGELTYARAGHAAPIVLGAEHHPEAEASAPPIGMGLGESWPEFRLEMTEGVSVCLFTDGLEDARVAGARLGRDAVTRLLAAHDVPNPARRPNNAATSPTRCATTPRPSCSDGAERPAGGPDRVLPVSLYDWLLFLHVLAAFLLVAGVVAYGVVVFGGGGIAAHRALVPPALALWNVGGIGVLILGIWLAIEVDAYEVWDGWIIAAIVLWFVASAAGGPLSRGLRAGDTALDAGRARVLVTVMALASLALLLDMIFKPGA